MISSPNDIVRNLEDWLGRLGRDASLGKRSAETVGAEIELVRRAIAEINGLREKLGERQGTGSITPEDLNASNDE
jgi:hypothetical protein